MKKDEYLGEELTKRTNEFLTDIEAFAQTGNPKQANTLFVDAELPNVPDEGFTYIQKNCKPEQLIIRTQDVLPNQKRYLVRIDLWNRLSNEEKAIAVTHEGIYGHLIDIQVNASPNARWYNGMLASDEVSRLGDLELVKLMKEYRFYNSIEKTHFSSNRAYTVLLWKRTLNGYIYDPIHGVQYEADGSFKSLENVKLTPMAQIELLKGQKAKIIAAKKIDFEGGKVVRVTQPQFNQPDDSIEIIRGLNIAANRYSALFPVIEFKDGNLKKTIISDEWDEIYIDLKTNKQVDFKDGVYSGYNQPTFTVKAYRLAKAMDLIGFGKTTTIESEGNGFVIKNARTFRWKTDNTLFLPFYGQMSLLAEGVKMRSRWNPTTIHLDQDLNVVKVERENLPWSKMGTY